MQLARWWAREGTGKGGRRLRRQEGYQLFLCIDMNINNRGSATRGQARRRTQSAWQPSLPPLYELYLLRSASRTL